MSEMSSAESVRVLLFLQRSWLFVEDRNSNDNLPILRRSVLTEAIDW